MKRRPAGKVEKLPRILRCLQESGDHCRLEFRDPFSLTLHGKQVRLLCGGPTNRGELTPEGRVLCPRPLKKPEEILSYLRPHIQGSHPGANVVLARKLPC